MPRSTNGFSHDMWMSHDPLATTHVTDAAPRTDAALQPADPSAKPAPDIAAHERGDKLPDPGRTSDHGGALEISARTGTSQRSALTFRSAIPGGLVARVRRHCGVGPSMTASDIKHHSDGAARRTTDQRGSGHRGRARPVPLRDPEGAVATYDAVASRTGAGPS